MLIDIDEARFCLDSLLRAKPCLQTSEARSYLWSKLYRYSLLDLYQWKLPEQFSQHPRSDRYRSYVKDESLQNSHSLLEVGFLQKLDTLLPEVPWNDAWYSEGIADWDFAADGLPLMDLGINIYGEDCLEALAHPMLVLAALSQNGQHLLFQDQDDLEAYLEKSQLWPVMRRALHSPTAATPAQQNAVRRRFNREPVPLRLTPMFVNLIDKRTGNYWLDAESDYERFPSGSSYHMGWNRESFAIAEQHGNRVGDYHQKVGALAQWIDADPPARLDHILNIWSQCLI